MPPLDGRKIFTVGGSSYLWEDVLLAGCLWGDWPALEDRVRAGLACLARLEALDADDEAAPDEEEVEEAAAEFRYARDLVAAADLETWLEERGLSIEGWMDFVRRGLLLARWTADLDTIRDAYEPDGAEIREALRCEAICSGVAAALAGQLAARAAVQHRAPVEVDTTEAERLAAAVPQALLRRLLPDIVSGAARERLASLAGLELAWRRFAEGIVTPRALSDLVTARRLDWVRLEARAVRVEDADVARELALCVREDRRSLAEVAEEAGLGVEAVEWWLEEAPPELRDVLLGAQPGDLLGPLPSGEAQLVLAVDAKRLPVEDDPEVVRRAAQALLARAAEREVRDQATWHATL